ncbi:reverse transcriptase domain-containing protein [Tanacetum coccineum]
MPHHGFTELHQIDTFYNSLTSTDQDSLNTVAGGNLLTKTPKDALTLIKNKSKVRTLRNRAVVAKVSTNTSTSSLSPDVAALTDAVKDLLLKNTTPPPAFVKAVEESCVTCCGPHPYYQCFATDGNASGYQENIQAYVSAAIVNYNQGNVGNLPPSSTMLQQNKKLENMLSNYFQMNKPSGSGSLPSNTIVNPKGDLKAITTRSGVSYNGPPIPPPFSPYPKVVEREPEVNENCSAVILKKLPEKLGDPVKFLIPCNFLEIVECLALADLGASINLLPLSIWRKLSLPELTPTQMILELAERSTTRPTGIAKDVFMRVGKFHFPTDFVVIDYVVDPRVPLILERPFLRTVRALIDVYGEELTLRVSDEAITFKVGNTSRYSYNDAESINRIDVIDVACEEYSQEVLGFSNNSESGNPTPISEPIIAKSSPSLTPFEGGYFILEEIEAYLASDLVPPGIDDAKFDPEGDICLIKEMLNKDPYSPLPPKDLTGSPSFSGMMRSHLEEKERIIKVLKSHKQAIAWKLSDIKGIDP